MKNNFKIFAPALGLCLLSFSATQAIASEDIETTETIVVSASKKPKPIETIGASITLIDKKELERNQSAQLLDALANTTGLSFARNGGYGQTSSIFMRGGESHDTLLVYDGISLSEPSLPSGNFDPANISIYDIGQIEILKGPQSVLYGSDAIGGVISIISQNPKKEFEGSANFEIGSLDTKIGRASIGGKNNALIYSLAAFGMQTAGISAKSELRGGIEKDGYENQSLNGRVSYEFNDRLGVIFRANYSQSKIDFDGFPAPLFDFADTKEFGKTKSSNLYFAVNSRNFGDRLKSVIAIKSSQSDRRNFDPSSSPILTYIATSQNQTYEYFGDLNLSEDLSFVFGALSNQQEYSARSPAPWDINPAAARAKSTQDSIYGELQFANKNGLYATIGARSDNHSSFGDNSVIRASIAYSPNGQKTRVHINYGEGFKAPSLFQISSDYGNPNLRPENASAIELGISQKLLENWQVSLIGFERESENQIDFFPCFGALAQLCATRPFGFYDKIKKARSSGFEIESKYRLGGLSIDAGIANIDAQNRTSGAANFGKSLARRPKTSANIAINYQWSPKFQTSINYNYVGERFDNASNSVRLKAYDLASIRMGYSLNETIEIYGRIENLFDKKYQIIRDYGTLPRTMNIGIRAKF